MRVRIVESGPGWATVQLRPGRLLTIHGVPGDDRVLALGLARFRWSETPPRLVDLTGLTLILDPLSLNFRVEAFLAHQAWEASRKVPGAMTRACTEAGAEPWEVRLLDLALQSRGPAPTEEGP